MKKPSCILITFALFIGFGGTLLAGDSNANKPQVIMSQATPIKENNLPVESNKPDDIQKQYLERLSNINLELKKAYITLLLNVRQTRLQHERTMLELGYRGSIPHDVEARGQEIKDEEIRTEDKKTNLERDKANLKLDVLKYYNGKLPEWLSRKWQEEESSHSNYVDEHYTQQLQK